MTSQSTPCPSTNSAVKELSISDLPLLCNTLNPVASKCFDLGLQLGVRYPQICNIERNYRTCEDQLREIISERLKQDPPLTWCDIVTALRSPAVNHPDIVRHIQSWYISPSLDLQQHPSSDLQQYGGERPYHMVMMGQTTVNRRENPNMGMASVPISSLWGAPFSNQMGASYWENYQPPTQMIGQIPVRGPPHGENYQPPTQIMGQTPVRGPPLGENYQPHTQMMGPTPVRGAPHEENYQPFPLMREPVDIRPPDRAALGSPYMYLPHHMTPYQTVHPNTLSTTQPYPITHTQGSSATAYHRSPMDTFVHYVKSTYKQCEIEMNLHVLKWPPTPSKIFINLACIDWESVVSTEEADEYTRAMVEDGNVDVIMKKKTNIDFNYIDQDLPPLTAFKKVVLVEGAPGVGKSTFAWEFCRRWERGEIAQQYQLVLLLRLRDGRMSRAKSLRDLIYHPSESVCQAVVEELELTFGVNTLIILEGFDELPDSQRKENSIFLELILGQLLLHATIMITSRSWATGALLVDIKHRIFLHIEILGFTEENITKYVTSVFTGEGKKTASAIDQSVGGPDEVSEEAKKNIDGVMAYIGKYPQIKACMYIPLNAAIVVSIYRDSMKSKWVLPTTLTELYESLTRFLLLRHLRGHAKYQKCRVESFEDLPGEVYGQFLDISKIAYNGICAESESVQLIFPDIPDDFETLGLMQSVSQLFMDGQKTSHNFLHLTFQEFLAAFLISTMSPTEQLEHFQRHKDGRLRVVLRFLAGLTKLNKVTTDELRSLLGEPTVEESDEHQTPYCNPMRPDVCVSAHHTNWLFEAQNSELLQSLFHNHTASFTFTRGMLPLEYYSVGYCIARSHSKWSLTFDGDTEEEKLHMLVSGAKTGNSDYRVAVKTTSMIPENIYILMTGFSSHVEELYYLKIPDNGNSLSLPPLSTLHILELQVDNNKSAFNIFCNLSFSSLEALIISSSCEGTTLGAKTCKAIGKLLSSTRALKEFHLSPTVRSHAFSAHVSNNGMEVITKGLSDNLSLKYLDMYCKCSFTTTAIQHVLNVITRNISLQHLKIGSDTFNISVKGFSDNIDLPMKNLDIGCKCTFTASATRSLVQFITRSTTLQNLEIRTDTFEDVDIFAKGLSENIALPLKSLGIDCKCTFTTTATRSLAQFITRSTTLQYIKIHIDMLKNVDTFAKGLSDNIALPLRSLDIGCKCTFTTTATRSLAQFITRSTTLQYLKIHIDMLKDVDTFAKGLSDNIALPLRSLDIGCKCTFTTTATRSLVQFITRITTLQYIRICNVTFSAQGLIELTEAIHHCSRLQEKRLEELTFRVECSEDVVNLRHMIKDHPDMRNSIDWNEVTEINKSKKMIDESNASTLSIALEYGHVTWLDLSNKSISNFEVEALAPVLYHNSTLKRLFLFNNNISDGGTVALAQALHHNSTLQKLHLTDNNISDGGAVALAQALHHNYTLEELYLSNNNISDGGAVALAQALYHNFTLKVLYLSNNNISDVGAVALAQALHHNSTLKELNLSYNDAIGKEGTHQLVQALTVNTSITKYGSLRLPWRCEKYATQCTQYNTVKDRIIFY